MKLKVIAGIVISVLVTVLGWGGKAIYQLGNDVASIKTKIENVERVTLESQKTLVALQLKIEQYKLDNIERTISLVNELQQPKVTATAPFYATPTGKWPVYTKPKVVSTPIPTFKPPVGLLKAKVFSIESLQRDLREQHKLINKLR